MKVAFVAALLAGLLGELGGAPFQCASDPDPERAMEDSAPGALYRLSESFREAGDSSAERATLEMIVRDYPSSRFAARARAKLGVADGEP